MRRGGTRPSKKAYITAEDIPHIVHGPVPTRAHALVVLLLLALLGGAALLDVLGLAFLLCGIGALLAWFARSDPVAGNSTLATGGSVLVVGLVGIAGALTDWQFGDVAWTLVGMCFAVAVLWVPLHLSGVAAGGTSQTRSA